MSIGIALALLAPLQQTTLQETTSGDDPVKARLEGSPRHHEWVDLARGERALRTFVAFPESKAKAQAVVVIHENKGLTDWVCSVADRLAEAGYVALAPDLLSGRGPGGGDTRAFESSSKATEAIYALAAADVLADLDLVVEHARTLSACDGRVSVAGFCWGGSKSWELATHRTDLVAAYVFYGSAPQDGEALGRIACPVYGFYGEDDARITAGLEPTSAVMKRKEKTFEPVVYPGAGHGFLRAGEQPDASDANKKAFEDGWKRWKELLAKR